MIQLKGDNIFFFLILHSFFRIEEKTPHNARSTLLDHAGVKVHPTASQAAFISSIPFLVFIITGYNMDIII